MVLSSDSWAVFTLMASPAKAYTKAGQIPPSAGYAPDAVLSTFWGHRQFTVCGDSHQNLCLWGFVGVYRCRFVFFHASDTSIVKFKDCIPMVQLPVSA